MDAYWFHHPLRSRHRDHRDFISSPLPEADLPAMQYDRSSRLSEKDGANENNCRCATHGGILKIDARRA